MKGNRSTPVRSVPWLAEPRVRAARETQKEPGGERAEFVKPPDQYDQA